LAALCGRIAHIVQRPALDISRVVFEKIAYFLSPNLFVVSAQVDPSKFLDKIYPAKTRRMGLQYYENCMI